jgi:ankyrin repeat protein
MMEMVNELQIIDTGRLVLSRHKELNSIESRLEESLSLGADQKNILEEDISAAIAVGDIDLLNKYLNLGGNPNFYNKRNHSLLECAFAAKNEEMISILIKHGADPNTTFSFGCKPLHRACSSRMRHVVELLLELGANPKERDSKNRTPLSRLNFIKNKKNEKKFEKIRVNSRIIKKIIEQKIVELETGNLEIEIDKMKVNENNLGRAQLESSY